MQNGEVRAMALSLLKRNRRDALSAALDRSTQFTESGDLRAASFWSRIALEIAELQIRPPSA
ncbi:MAG TPA: hypothetical protein VHV26_11630 [Rhizomicrobium sp.]|jgi:hypothetical protein|nr:hypothetical protein [Rhizomicrobium sp.]